MRMAMNEVEDPVRSRPRAIDEVGPGNGALRRNARPQTAESAGRAHLLKIGEQPFLYHARGQARVHPVDADDDDLLSHTSRNATDASDPVRRRGRAGGADRG